MQSGFAVMKKTAEFLVEIVVFNRQTLARTFFRTPQNCGKPLQGCDNGDSSGNWIDIHPAQGASRPCCEHYPRTCS
jgi:hypothetical protein